MLSISAPMSGSGQGNYYLNLARDDYYLKGGEPPGYWLGQGSERLGLGGKVESEHFRALLMGFAPDGIIPLVQNAEAADRQCGWDLTFSAPKSVSALWSQANEGDRLAIQDAHKKAVSEAFSFLEEKAGITRRGHGGKIKERVDWIGAAFEHGTSRNLDPQLHTHVILVNIGMRDDRSTGALVSKELFKNKIRGGKEYQEALAHELKDRLGISVSWKQTGAGRTFEVEGVSSQLCETFSSRRKEIEKVLAERGHSSAEAAKIAALDTRSRKELISREKLFSAWQEVGEKHGFSKKESVILVKRPTRKIEQVKERTKPKIEQNRSTYKPQKLPKTKVLWTKPIPFAKIEVVQKRLFPRAPAWSPAAYAKLPSIRIRSDVEPWAKFLANKAAQGALSVMRSAKDATAEILARCVKTKPVVVSAEKTAETLKREIGDQAKEIISEKEAKKVKPTEAVCLLDAEALNQSPADFLRLAESVHFVTDENSLRARFSVEIENTQKAEALKNAEAQKHHVEQGHRLTMSP